MHRQLLARLLLMESYLTIQAGQAWEALRIESAAKSTLLPLHFRALSKTASLLGAQTF